MQSAATSGVVYHHLNIPDLQNPALLADYGAFNVLEEVTSLSCRYFFALTLSTHPPVPSVDNVHRQGHRQRQRDRPLQRRPATVRDDTRRVERDLVIQTPTHLCLWFLFFFSAALLSSPTMFLAWMITRGFDVDKAIKMIGKDYNDPHFEWKDKYVKTRCVSRAYKRCAGLGCVSSHAHTTYL